MDILDHHDHVTVPTSTEQEEKRAFISRHSSRVPKGTMQMDTEPVYGNQSMNSLDVNELRHIGTFSEWKCCS